MENSKIRGCVRKSLEKQEEGGTHSLFFSCHNILSQNILVRDSGVLSFSASLK